MAALGALGSSASDGRGCACLVCATGVSAESVPGPQKRGGGVGPHAGAGIGCPVDIVVEAGVEPTNNRTERALRFAVLWRKRMLGTYNEKGDRWVERILSVRETCRLRGRPTFLVLVEAVTCAFNGQHPDVSWISWIRPPEPLREKYGQYSKAIV